VRAVQKINIKRVFAMLALKPDKPTYRIVNITLESDDLKAIRRAYKMPLATNTLIVKSAIKDLAKILALSKKHPAELIEDLESKLDSSETKVA
jgi:hypothetical protein